MSDGVLKEFLSQKPEKPHFLKRPNSRSHYILWWTELGDFCNVHKSKGKRPKEEMASWIVSEDVEAHIQYYIRNGYSFYSEIKLTFSGQMKEEK